MVLGIGVQREKLGSIIQKCDFFAAGKINYMTEDYLKLKVRVKSQPP